MSNNSIDQAMLEPHLTDVVRSGGRYPSPFFDLGQQYMPRTTRELFRWCSYYYYTNPLVGATITKVSRYPITDLILEDPDNRTTKLWENIFNDCISIKEKMMEVNLDLNVYGNAFVSMHFPFNRFLICPCGHRTNIREVKFKFNSFAFHYKCAKCGQSATADPERPETIKDVYYKSKNDISFIRWNPENIRLRYSEATARSTYYYTVNYTLRRQIEEGDPDILADIPLLFILAVKKQQTIKLSTLNLFHLKRPTLAEKDMGWGKPLIYHVLKDLYYMTILRKAQEAIANEHIVPFDFLFPQANAQMDPFVHTDLGSWRSRVEEAVKKHRFDPNYKAVMPVPLGFGRLGGDGKALMLTPELNYLNNVIVGGMGIPSDFLFGNMTWSGSSVTLRSLQNDFLHNQSQLLKLVRWSKDKIRNYLQIPDVKSIRFVDFKMADDVQKIQQYIGLEAQNKISARTMLTELGLDYEQEQQRIFTEVQERNKIQDLMAKLQAKTSGEAQLIQMNYQQKIQKIQSDAIAANPDLAATVNGGAPQPGTQPSTTYDSSMTSSSTPTDQNGDPIPGAQAAVSNGGQVNNFDINRTVKAWATKLSKMEPSEKDKMIGQIKAQDPQLGLRIDQMVNEILANATSKGVEVNMNPLPEKGIPRRAGSV